MHRALFLILLALPASTQTILVQNAASPSPGIPLNGVAPGSIINLRRVPEPNSFFDETRQISVRVKPASAGSEISLPVLPAPFFQIWALLPADLPFGPADLTLTINGEAGTARIQVVPNAVGLFARSGFGFGAALATNDDVSAPPTINRLTNPALPGQYVTLWGTGLGKAPNGAVTVKVGGRPVTSSYAGPAPGFPGVDQINLPLPADAPDGCYVSLVVEAGDSISNELSIAKASRPGPCQHPLGLSPADLQALDAGGSVLLGSIGIQSGIVVSTRENTYTRFDAANASFLDQDAVIIGLLAQPVTADENYFSCTLTHPIGVAGVAIFAAANEIDAGEKLILSGPGKTLDLIRLGAPTSGTFGARGPSFYSAQLDPSAPVASPKDLPPSLFSPGIWQISGTGGRTINAFQQGLTLPPSIRWTNRDSLMTIDRSKDQTITWDPDGYSDADVLTVTLSSGSGVLCRAHAAAGTITLPANLMQQIPPSAPGLLNLRLAPHPSRRALFSLPLANGRSAPALFDYSFSEALLTTIQ